MRNALTVDVEDYFHVTAFEGVVRREQWDVLPLRVEGNTARILDLLDGHGVKATFFVLGWVAEKCPTVVKAIAARGHEVACHGYAHRRISQLGAADFRADVTRAKGLLEDLCGTAVIGYRAPSFSITRDTTWALDILIEEGFRYDSSIFPVRHDIYGMPEAPACPHDIVRPAGTIREFPLTTFELRLLGRAVRIPAAGGGYLRLFPVAFLERAFRRANEAGGYPAVLYFHPWEIDPGQPRIRAGLKSTFRHYLNLSGTLGKLEALLAAFRFAPMAEVLGLG